MIPTHQAARYMERTTLIAAALAVAAIIFAQHHAASPSTKSVRDSVALVDSVRAEQFDSFAVHVPADTLAIILRDLARRPPVRVIRDTIRDTVTTAEDVSSQPCEVAISCSEAQG